VKNPDPAVIHPEGQSEPVFTLGPAQKFPYTGIKSEQLGGFIKLLLGDSK
jgi:hypothetical protein